MALKTRGVRVQQHALDSRSAGDLESHSSRGCDCRDTPTLRVCPFCCTLARRCARLGATAAAPARRRAGAPARRRQTPDARLVGPARRRPSKTATTRPTCCAGPATATRPTATRGARPWRRKRGGGRAEVIKKIRFQMLMGRLGRHMHHVNNARANSCCACTASPSVQPTASRTRSERSCTPSAALWSLMCHTSSCEP